MKIKNYFVLLSTILISYTATAQIGIGTTNPDKSSMLDITSNNTGVLIPRVSLTSSTDTVTIPTPATSLLVYNTNASATLIVGFCYWDGTLWRNLNSLKAYAEISKTTTTQLVNGEIVLGTAGFNQNVAVGANPTKIKAPKDGIYKVSYTVSLKKTGGGAISPEFYLGISGTEISGTRTYTTLSNGEGRTVTLSKLCRLNALEEVSIYSNLADNSTNVINNGTLLLLELVN